MPIRCLAFLVCGLSAAVASAVPLVYTGYSVSFEKISFADETLPENQDSIIGGISITRASSRGIFNIAQEEAFVDFMSPLGTAWAFPFNNPEATLSAAECTDGCPEIVFEDWQTAFGGAGAGGPPSTVGQDAIVHLLDQDIYLDIRFTSWVASAAGGGFGYERADITPSADFDRDGDVDGRDFLTWQRHYDQADALQTQGDADFDGVVSSNDLALWQNSYGSSLFAVIAVPEPSGGILWGLIALIIAPRFLR